MGLQLDLVDDVPLSILKHLDEAWAQIVATPQSMDDDEVPLTVVFSSARCGARASTTDEETEFDSFQGTDCENLSSSSSESGESDQSSSSSSAERHSRTSCKRGSTSEESADERDAKRIRSEEGSVMS